MFNTRKRNRIMTLLAASLLAGSLSFIASCGGTGKKDRDVTADDVKEEIVEAADTTMAFLNEEKQNLIAEYRTRLQIARDQIEDYNQKVAEAGDAMVEQYSMRVADLEAAAVRTQSKMDTLRTSSESAWAELKEGVETALNDLEQAIQDARDEFSDSTGE